ncbi:hypothetical protein M9H77_09349 [Catharanthus roseus]|uniref:Uncharacterized protein n=1 Tax=Catharanthus roseus TaxID=4058 RepID=A0ACC0C0J4_CATRO|nr:hypothetical protein M9H77_09349 [Catharanthus roseus]
MERRQDDLPSFEETPQITREMEESKKDECLLEKKNEFAEGEPEKENENLVESQEDHTEERQETQIEVIKKNEENSLCVQALWKQTTENVVERRHLIKAKSDYKNFYFYVGMSSHCIYRFILVGFLPTFFEKNGLLSKKNEVPFRSRNDEKETKKDHILLDLKVVGLYWQSVPSDGRSGILCHCSLCHWRWWRWYK